MRIGKRNILGLLLLIGLLVSCPLAMGSEVEMKDIYKGPRPLFVLVEDNLAIWRQAPLDPTFIVYEDGLVLYREDPYLSTPFYSVNLDSDSLEKLKSRLIDEKIFKMAAVYSVIEGRRDFKGISNRLYFFDQGRSKEIQVDAPTPYFFDKENEVHFKPGFWQGKDIQRLPELIRRVFETAKTFKTSSAKLWKPEKVEVLYKTDTGKIPSAWEVFPRIQNSHPRGYYHYSIYVSEEEGDKMCKEFKGSSSERIFQIRNVYPNEPMWTGRMLPRKAGS